MFEELPQQQRFMKLKTLYNATHHNTVAEIAEQLDLFEQEGVEHTLPRQALPRLIEEIEKHI